MDFKIIWHNCSPSRADVPFETLIQVGKRSRLWGLTGSPWKMLCLEINDHFYNFSCFPKIISTCFFKCISSSLVCWPWHTLLGKSTYHLRIFCLAHRMLTSSLIFVAFVEDNATMSSVRYFENRVPYFVQNRRK